MASSLLKQILISGFYICTISHRFRLLSLPLHYIQPTYHICARNCPSWVPSTAWLFRRRLPPFSWVTSVHLFFDGLVSPRSHDRSLSIAILPCPQPLLLLIPPTLFMYRALDWFTALSAPSTATATTTRTYFIIFLFFCGCCCCRCWCDSLGIDIDR